MTFSDYLSIVLIAFGLSADCFAVALGSGVSNKGLGVRGPLRVSISFGLFQAVMPLLGWAAGRTVINPIASFDHWLAFGLLGFVGGKMLLESFRNSDQEGATDISKGWLLITMSVATSIDALAVGLSFAFLNVSVAVASPIIGIVAMGVTALGLAVGRKAARVIGKRAETLGGLILMAIAVRVLLTHLP